MATRKRSGSGSKRQMKEKIVQIYECFFRGEDPSVGNPNFWEEFFLMKPKVGQLEAEVLRPSGEQLAALKGNLNVLFAQCVHTLGHEHHIRVVYALQTLCALIQSVYKKTSGDFGYDVIDILMGFDAAENQMRLLLSHLCGFLTGDYPDSLKALCLKLLLVMTTGTENVSQNTLLEYLMLNSVFEALVQLVCTPAGRLRHGHDAAVALMLLANYRKQEAANPYVVKLSILDDELALNGLSQVITAALADFCLRFASQHQDPPSAGWLSSLTSMVGSMFVSDDNCIRNERLRANDAMLMVLYEAVHLNRNFITTLATTQPDTSSSNSAPAESTGGVGDSTITTIQATTATTTTTAEVCPAAGDLQPSNLLVTFLEYCSIVMQDTKSEASSNTVQLCFLILTCIAEDQYANSLMHDPNLSFRVRLHRMPMRHRKMVPAHLSASRPLACALLDLMVEFVLSHMLKKLPLELYLQSVGVVQRVLCYQKKSRVRLAYEWRQLWTALVALLRFLLANEAGLTRHLDIFPLATAVVNLFNLFVTYGDTFLPSPAAYDELYYEIVRVHQVFDNLYSMALRYSTSDGEFKDGALKLTNSLVNIRAIINHFSPKIDAWLSSQSLSTPSEEQILEVVKSNYDSLTLKLQDSLDQYERYAEKPRYSAFFTGMVRAIAASTRHAIDFASLDLHHVLHDFSSIS